MTLRTIKTAATRLIAAFSALSAVPAMAASADQAFQKGSDAINWVFLGLTGMSVVTISCAVAFIAYKMLVDGKARTISSACSGRVSCSPGRPGSVPTSPPKEM
ncbi:conjugal transfer protein TrbC [Escherichia fergusonii]|uniref:conjugal transfer protein TrbC n=1 Tax=Escherichia fergusonii TaxID=564 RepID=UPI00210063F6|nr:conjugal transfer protein TrbC [Escherichia fergusonii]